MGAVETGVQRGLTKAQNREVLGKKKNGGKNSAQTVNWEGAKT